MYLTACNVCTWTWISRRYSNNDKSFQLWVISMIKNYIYYISATPYDLYTSQTDVAHNFYTFEDHFSNKDRLCQWYVLVIVHRDMVAALAFNIMPIWCGY